MACCSALFIDQFVRSNHQIVSSSFHLSIYLVELLEPIRIHHVKIQFTSKYVFSKLKMSCFSKLNGVKYKWRDILTIHNLLPNTPLDGYPCYVSNNNNNFMSQNIKKPTSMEIRTPTAYPVLSLATYWTTFLFISPF